MISPRQTAIFSGLVYGALLGPAGAGAALADNARPPAVSGAHPAAAAPALPEQQAVGQPAEDEIVELPAESRPAPRRANLQVSADRLEALEQKNADLTQRLADLERRLDIVANPPSAVRLTGYIDAGFFAFFRGNGSGITNYLAPPSDDRIQRFPAFFGPCGFGADMKTPAPCPRLQGSGPFQSQAFQNRWRFLGDPLATAINSQGQPADTRSQDLPGQSSLAVPYDYIQSAGRPSFIINEVNLTPIAKLGAGFQAVASVSLFPRSASVSFGDKQDGGSVQPAGPTHLGDYLGVDLAFLEWATTFSQGRHQLSVFAGRFDPNIGIEYRVRKSPDRFGVTPSLLCRYSCGTPIGVKVRGRFFDEWLSVAVAVHNGSSYQENFRFSEQTDKKYMKTLSGRIALHAPVLGGVEIGLSGEYGGEVDGFYDVGQKELDPFVSQWTVDVDAHLEYRGLEARFEYLKSNADGFIGSIDKPALPRLAVQGAYLELSYRLLNWLGLMVRWDVRDAVHVDYAVPFAYDALLWRIAAAARFDINENIAFKAEYVHVQPFGRMSDGLQDNAGTIGAAAGDYQADYLTTALVLRY